MEAFDGRAFHLADALTTGGIFATFMVSFNLISLRRRGQHADGRTAA